MDVLSALGEIILIVVSLELVYVLYVFTKIALKYLSEPQPRMSRKKRRGK